MLNSLKCTFNNFQILFLISETFPRNINSKKFSEKVPGTWTAAVRCPTFKRGN